MMAVDKDKLFSVSITSKSNWREFSGMAYGAQEKNIIITIVIVIKPILRCRQWECKQILNHFYGLLIYMLQCSCIKNAEPVA